MAPRLPPLLHPPVAFGQPDPRAVPVDEVADEASAPRGLERLLAVVDRGATGLAATVWTSADGVAVLAPSDRIGSRLRRRRIGSLPAADLPADTVTSLTSLYRRIDPGLPLWLEMGDPGAFDAVLTAARSRGDGAERKLWLVTEDLAALTDWRPRTEARLVNRVGYRSLGDGLERRAAELEQRSIDALGLDHQDWTGGRVALLHRFGRLAIGSGPVFEREMAALIDAGIDGVVTSRVPSLVAVMEQFYGPS